LGDDREAHVSGLEPTPEQFAVLLARPSDATVVMVNLLTFSKDGGPVFVAGRRGMFY
jgi:hypothetical protein